jgi:hypothetical protein
VSREGAAPPSALLDETVAPAPVADAAWAHQVHRALLQIPALIASTGSPPGRGEVFRIHGGHGWVEQPSCQETAMSSETTSDTGTGRTRHRRAWLNGYTVFAVAIMFVLGLWQVLAGITAVVRDRLYGAPPGYVYGFDIVVWGWVLIVLGALLAGAAVVVLLGRDGGDTAAIWLACLGMVANFWCCRSTRSGL